MKDLEVKRISGTRSKSMVHVQVVNNRQLVGNNESHKHRNPRGGGGSYSPMKMAGLLVGNLTPLKGTRVSFCGRGFQFIYTPKRYQF